MKKQISDAQLAFDFNFNETIAAIDRITEDAAADPDDLENGAIHVDKPNPAPRYRQTSVGVGDDLLSSSGSVPPSRLEDPRSLGIEQPNEAEVVGEGGGNRIAGPSARSAEFGTLDPVGRDGVAEQRGLRERGVSDESGGDRAAVVPATDYRITDTDRLGEGGAKTKFRDNIAALRVLKMLEDERRSASIEEQAVLVRYVGWGGLPQAFDRRNTEWAKEFAELSDSLSGDEYDAARRSTQDAHYTAKPVVEAIHSALTRLGFDGGRILEPAIGTGNFVGLMPEPMFSQSQITGVELDPTTAHIAKHLYPSTSLINKGLQDVTIPSGYFDLALGNPPFGSQTVFDKNHRDLSRLSIHNYFIAKSLDKVREGGLVAVVVSNFFLDAHDTSAREHIASRAHLVGAIRLPNTAFKQNALTEVTTDIVFLQKAASGELPSKEWVTVQEVPDPAGGEPIPLNQYFATNPQMMLGEMARVGTQYRKGSPALVARPGQDLAAALVEVVGQLPSGIYKRRESMIEIAASLDGGLVPEGTKVGAYFVNEAGSVAQRLDDELGSQQSRLVGDKSERALDRIKGMVGIREALRRLMGAERQEHVPEDVLASLRSELNRAYDTFQRRQGHLSSLVNRQAMGEDPDYPLLQSLERDYDKGISKEIAKKHGVEAKDPTAQKAAIFFRRVMTPRRDIQKVESSKDALVVSLNETGRVDLDLMVRLTGRDEDAIIRDLQGLIFLDPHSKRWENSDRYLTGNVKAKLLAAEEALLADRRFAGNVEALRLVQPVDIEPIDISIQLGSTWVPDKVIDDFVGHIFGGVHRSISYQSSLGKWVATIGAGDHTTMRVKWGTEDLPANRIVEAILTNKVPEVKEVVGYDQHNNPIRERNEEKTAAVSQKADEIRQAFLDWVWEDKPRRESLARIYNDRFNTNVAPRYDGSHLTLPGASTAIELRPSQKGAIWRGIQDGTELYDHVVGAGKTFACIATAMEAKRMGLVKKPMFNVPNHLLLQWKDDFFKLYPDANILVAEKSDFQKENRERLLARIATGDWDAVIVGHSSFKKIGMPPQILENILNEQITDLTDAVVRLKEDRGDRVTIKQMEKARDRMKAKLERAAETGQKDRVVTFDELGIDALFVDEADEYKNLFITTTLTDVSGLGNLQGSDKAFDLFVKARYLQSRNEGRGLYFATGTPVANTIVEIYTMQRYMQYDELKARGIHHFDAWASTFGQVVTGWELDATGVNYRLNSRFAKFQNVPELTALYRTFADVITREDLERQAAERGTRFPVPRLASGKPRNIVVDRSPMQAEYMGLQVPALDADGEPLRRADGTSITDWTPGSIIHRMENLPKDPSKDNPLKITNDARKAGLDFRLVNPDAPDFEGSKTNVAVAEMVRIYNKWNHKRGTQLVFCDLSTPKPARGIKGGTDHDAVVPADEHEQDELDGDEIVVSMDELLATKSSSRFSVYDDVKAKLILQGIPADEIRFIHDAKTDLQRAKLFDQVRRGDVRFLIGSTAKMGAGTNVQTLLVAEHHLDAPWRPRDLEQREGRIIRQGNALYEEDPDGFEIEILRYATKQTYDSRMWQTIEYKARAIEQFRRGDSLARVIEDVASEAANAAEMKAAATGNPLIFLQVQLAAELKKLEALQANHKRSRHALEGNIEWLATADERATRRESAYVLDIAKRDANTRTDWSMNIGGRSFNSDSKEAMMTVLTSMMAHAIEGRTKTLGDKPTVVHVGKYRGFSVTASADSSHIQFALKNEDGGEEYRPENLRYSREDKFSVTGFIQRMDNTLGALEQLIEWTRARCESERGELEKARGELAKPFQQARELELFRQNNADVMRELRRMQDDPSYVSTWEPATLDSVPHQNEDLLAMLDPNTVEHATQDANYQKEVKECIRKAAEDYLRGSQMPHRSDDVFNREHDRLFEWEGGTDVHDGLVAQIREDRGLAEAVAGVPGKRFATEMMLEAAESVLQYRALAWQTAVGAGYTPSNPDRFNGTYSGRVVAQTAHHLVQEVGRGQAIVHNKHDVLDVGTAKSDSPIRLSYRAGTALARTLHNGTDLSH